MLAALRARDFRLLWFGQTASVIGDELVIVAIGLYVTRLTGNASDVGLVLAAYSLPLALFVLFGGVVADRIRRQTLMVISDVIRGTLHGVLAILIDAPDAVKGSVASVLVWLLWYGVIRVWTWRLAARASSAPMRIAP